MDAHKKLIQALDELAEVSKRLIWQQPGSDQYENLRRKRDKLITCVRDCEDQLRRERIKNTEDYGDDR